MHRFVWPLHYAPSAKQHDPYADGAWAPPGRYTIELDADGKRQRQTLDVAADPRIDLPASAYAEQFALARRVEALQADIGAANEEAGALRDGMLARRQQAGGDTAAALDAFAERLAAVSGARPATNPHNAWNSPPRSVETLAFVHSSLGALFNAIESADAAPSADMRVGAEKLSALSTTTLRAWSDFKRDDLRALNAALASAHLAPLGSSNAGTPK